MKGLSLRARALLGGIVWIVIAVGLSGYVLLSTFDEISERAFRTKLLTQVEQIEALIASGALDAGLADGALEDPFFRRGGEGRYWQIELPTGQVLLSATLEGAPIPDRAGAAGRSGPIAEYQQRLRGGPQGDAYVTRIAEGLQVEVLSRDVQRVGPDGRPGVWTVKVAEARVSLSRDQLEFRRSLFGALIGLGASLVLAGAAQTGMALRPLVALRASFLGYRAGQSTRIEGEYPSDIATLVDDLNELLDRNEEMLRRARRQAADLAHALKTPAAVLRNDLNAPMMGRAEAEMQRARMIDALNRIDGLITRYTARARMAGAAPGAVCAVAPVVHTLGRIMGQVHRGADLFFREEIPEALKVRAEEEDLEELLGNLIDNAHKWAVGVVKVSARQEGAEAFIIVEDDGPGIPEEGRQKALAAGARLDEAVPGTGLGLAICSDVVQAYGGEMTLGESAELGGLSVTVRLPAPDAPVTTPRRAGTTAPAI